MEYSRRAFLYAGCASLRASPRPEIQPVTADRVHLELVRGNLRFSSGHSKHPHSSPKWIHRTTAAQHPQAIVLCCSDSRVVPELLFDQGIGDLFTVRVAGNVANEDELASIEYAAGHFGAPLCVVLGHSNCGAVSAVVEVGELPGEIDRLVVHVREAFQTARAKYPNAQAAALIEATVRANVIRSLRLLEGGPHAIRELVEQRKLRLDGGVYDLATGRVSWIEPGEWP